MKAIINLILIVLFYSIIGNVLSQNIEFDIANFSSNREGLKTALANIEQGNQYYTMGGGAYALALEPYLKAHKFNPNNALLNYKIGVCYLNSIDKTKCISYFLKAQQLNKNVAEDLQYNLARGYHLNLEFDKAIAEYEAFYNLLSPEAAKNWQKIVQKRIEECKYGKEYLKNPVRVKISNVGGILNSPFPDYRPLISTDESMMIFTSRRSNTTGGKTSEYDNKFFEDIYMAESLDTIWLKPKNIGPPVNTDDHDAAVGLSPDGQQVLLYKTNKKTCGNIYVSYLLGDKWKAPVPLANEINSEYGEFSASFASDGRTLYFVSNRKNDDAVIKGKSYKECTNIGRDIYVSKMKNDSSWTKPEKLPSQINTEYEEASVFIHPDGRTLFFSSQGHSSMGGFDIFKTILGDDGKWSEPENLGYPINTPDDDVFFVVSASGKNAYFSSVRQGGSGDQDIYRITFLEEEKLLPPRLTILKGTVKDAVTLEPLEATIDLVDNNNKTDASSFKSNSKTGKYLVSLPSGKNYGLAVRCDGYMFHSENFNIPESAAYQEIVKDILLNKLQKGTKVILRNIFFDFDKATLRQQSNIELDRLIALLKEHPTMRIEISGHTDNKGSLDYNLRLSTDRAKSVVEYLIAGGIDKTRLEYKGYAFNQPIATNETEEGRQLNRRVEFKILSE